MMVNLLVKVCTTPVAYSGVQNPKQTVLFNRDALPVPLAYRVQYKILITVRKALHGAAPQYLADLIHPTLLLRHLIPPEPIY